VSPLTQLRGLVFLSMALALPSFASTLSCSQARQLLKEALAASPAGAPDVALSWITPMKSNHQRHFCYFEVRGPGEAPLPNGEYSSFAAMSGLIGHFAVNTLTADLWETDSINKVSDKGTASVIIKWRRRAGISSQAESIHGEEFP